MAKPKRKTKKSTNQASIDSALGRGQITRVGIVLDRSGSMFSIWDSAVEMFNEQIRVTKDAQKEFDGDYFITSMNFDTQHEFLTKNSDVHEVPDLRKAGIAPRGATALNDAIMLTLDEMEAFDDRDFDVAYLLIVITDGCENSSVEFPGEEGKRIISDRLERLQETGDWTAVYIGTDHDVLAASNSYGISPGNSMSFTKSVAGTENASNVNFLCMDEVYTNRSRGIKTCCSVYTPDETGCTVDESGNTNSDKVGTSSTSK